MGVIDTLVYVLAPLIDYIATNFRPVAMVVFVLPLSFILRHYFYLRDVLLVDLLSADADDKSPLEAHKKKVERVQKQVKARYEKFEKLKAANPESYKNDVKFMCTARAPWQNLSTRFASYKENADKINVSDLKNVLEFDPIRKTVTVEPLIEVGTITDYLLERGFMLATTLEITEATIGGLALAAGMTTASFRYAMLHETVEDFEVVLGNGEVVHVRRDNEYKDLYKAMGWSHGTLCLLLSLKLQIIPVKKFVKVTYNCFKNDKKLNYCKKIREETFKTAPNWVDFIEATIYTKENAVVMTGEFTNEVDVKKIYNAGFWFNQWYYCHVRDMLDDVPADGESHSFVEYIPTHDYIFRHNRAIFWTLRDQLPEKIGNHPVFRFLLGWLCPPKVTFLKLPATKKIKEEMMTKRVYQDVVLPLPKLEESIKVAADLFEIWPILIYPSKIFKTEGQFPNPRDEDLVKGTDYGFFYDIGIYGIPQCVLDKTGNNVKPMRAMEKFTSEIGGAPFLYADTFMTREEFGKMFDLSHYEKMRKKYDCEDHFPHLYDKTSGCQSFDWQKFV